MERSPCFFAYIGKMVNNYDKRPLYLCDFLKQIVPKINKKGGFIDMNLKMSFLRNMYTQICVMFQKQT